MKIKISLLEPGIVKQIDAWKRSRLDDLTPAMSQIGRYQKAQVLLGFRGSKSPEGVPWAPLKYRVGQPLRDTGRLMNSITFVARDNRMAIGTNVDYAKPHQFGARIANTQGDTMTVIPARPFLPTERLPKAWEPRHVQILAAHLKGGS